MRLAVVVLAAYALARCVAFAIERTVQGAISPPKVVSIGSSAGIMLGVLASYAGSSFMCLAGS